jgi:hypothetical protein
MSKALLYPGCKIEGTASGRIHKCSICGKEGIWAKGWEWRYQIHRGDESVGDPEWEELIKTCSPECRDKDSQDKPAAPEATSAEGEG